MSRIKEFYHEEICKATEYVNENPFLTGFPEQLQKEIIDFENAQILKRAEEMEHSEMPNFFR